MHSQITTTRTWAQAEHLSYRSVSTVKSTEGKNYITARQIQCHKISNIIHTHNSDLKPQAWEGAHIIQVNKIFRISSKYKSHAHVVRLSTGKSHSRLQHGQTCSAVKEYHGVTCPPTPAANCEDIKQPVPSPYAVLAVH